MNWLKRLFKRKIKEKDLNQLILSLGKSKEYLNSIYETRPDGYSTITKGYLDIKSQQKDFIFDLDIFTSYFHSDPSGDKEIEGTKMNIKKTIPYGELNKNPVIKEYIKGKFLEKFISIL